MNPDVGKPIRNTDYYDSNNNNSKDMNRFMAIYYRCNRIIARNKVLILLFKNHNTLTYNYCHLIVMVVITARYQAKTLIYQ